jgi:hypothetical protein
MANHNIEKWNESANLELLFDKFTLFYLSDNYMISLTSYKIKNFLFCKVSVTMSPVDKSKKWNMDLSALK